MDISLPKVSSANIYELAHEFYLCVVGLSSSFFFFSINALIRGSQDDECDSFTEYWLKDGFICILGFDSMNSPV